MAHTYCTLEHLSNVKSYRNNDSIVILKPGKSVGIVIHNRRDYLSKIADILNYYPEVIPLGCVDEFDKTSIQEQHIQRQFLGFMKTI